MVFEPIDNHDVELLLEAAMSDDNKKLEDFVVAEFFSKKQLELPIRVLTPDIIYLIECTKYHLKLNGDERRKINNNLNSKHSIDVNRALKYYGVGDVINPITMISAIFHDEPEEGKKTVIQIGNFLEYTIIHSLGLDVKTREQYLVDVNKIRENINLLTDPYYKCLQKIKQEVDAHIAFYEKNKLEIPTETSRLKEIIDEEKGQSLINKLHSISKRILSDGDLPKYLVEPIKKYIDAIYKDYIDFLRGTHFKKWVPRVIKIGEGIPQNYELDEIPYLDGEGTKGYLRKHEIVQRYKQSFLDELKKGKKDNDLFVDDLTLGEYNALEDFKISGSDVLQAIAKRFFNLDFCCNHINATTQYTNKLATTINLKNALVETTLNVIKTRKKHLREGFHVTEEDIIKIEKDIENYERDGNLYRVTDIGSPNDMLKYYLSAMRGDYDALISLDFDKNLQYRHLKLWEHVFLRYKKDCIRDSLGKLKHKDLFPFDWGEYLDVRNGNNK